MSNLPLELIHIIVAQVANDRPTLYSLCLASKYLNDAATRFLYSKMVDDSSMVHNKFIEAIRQNPKLAVFVRVYYVPAVGLKPQRYTWTDILSCLKLMVNLEELVVPPIMSTNSSEILPILCEGDQPTFQLKRFACWARSPKTMPDGLGRFLGSQYRLEYLWLKVPLYPDIISLPDSLKCIRGTSDIVMQLLRIKPSVREVCWSSDTIPWSRERHARPKLLELQAFRRIRVLNIISGLVSEEGAIMRDIRNCGVGKFEELEVLVIRSLLSLKDPDILRSFPKLSEIIVSMPWLWEQTPTKIIPEGEKAIIESLFAAHGNLVEVDVYMDNVRYRRWVKGKLIEGSYVLSREKSLAYLTC